ncbi:LOW QUALITY PROTEIN: uncharacterized protein RHO17_009331 [Thomomys bottae]
MTAQNHTGESPFLLLGLSDDPQLQPILFGLFLSMYLITVLGNLLIIQAIISDAHVHTPMYFFLSNLSFVDLCFTTTTIPKMLVNIQTQRKDISYPECLTQVYFFMIFGGMANFLLTVMAYDRFVAICHPLNYPVIMNPHFCGLLVLVSWFLIFCISLLHVLLMRKLTFSSGSTIPHFFCELAQILKVAISDTLINDICVYLAFVWFGLFAALGIFFSYSQILSSLMKVLNTASKHKAFSTCGSHLCVVSLFYGTGLGVYLSSAVSSSTHRSKVASVMYTVFTPMLNPFIYSLRNQDVMGALGEDNSILLHGEHSLHQENRKTARAMAAQNHTGESPFLLLGLSDDPQLQPLLFGIFLSMYLITVLGNLLIILAVTSDPHLHTPMYFFLSNLSFVDICFTSTTVPKMLVDIQTQRKDSYPECLTQVYFFMIFVGMENFLLTVMAYDRFVAICHPLNFPVIMNPHFCGLLVLVSWLLIFCISLHHILLMRKLTFSPGTTIPHFFCELAQVLQVASSATLINDIWMYLDFVLFCVFPALGIFFSYHQILSSLMKLPNMASKHKAFSTCGSHLCVVSLFYGTVLGVYLSSAMSASAHRSKVVSVMYTVVTPMLNPFIYSLRNQYVMGALGRLPGRVVSCLDGL